MKYLALIFSLLISFNARAEFISKNYKTAKLAPLTVYEVRPLCPSNGDVHCFMDGTLLILKTSVACGEKLGDASVEAVEIDGELHVFAAASLLQAVENDPCLGPQEVLMQVALVNQFGEVKLHSLNRNNAVRTLRTATLQSL